VLNAGAAHVRPPAIARSRPVLARVVSIGWVVMVLMGAVATRTAGALPLGHDGRWMTDSAGRVVILHGVNMVNKLAPYYPAAVGFGDDDAAFLSRVGFNAVRVGVIWKAVEPMPGVYDDGYIEHIRATVETLARHGVRSLIDFHQDLYNQRFQGEGAPDWAVQDDGLPAAPLLGFPGNYTGLPALEAAFDHFWANSPGPGGIGLQVRYASAWRHVALRLRDTPGLVGYDLFNEPWPGTSFPQCLAPAGCPAFDGKLTAFYHRVDAAIRTVDRRTLVWYEPNVLFDFGDTTNVGALRDPRAGFTFHDYCAAASSTGCASEAQPFANALAHVRSTREAVLLSEFGATNAVGDLSGMVARADAAMVPWLEWAYCGCHDPTTTGPGTRQAIVIDPSKPPRGANLEHSTLRALVEPYPQLISGTPQRWAFDRASATFRFGYASARSGKRGVFPAGSVTRIAAPALVYPRGYGVRVRGGQVVSARGAPVLEIAACQGARRIAVTIRPSGGRRGSCNGGVRRSSSRRARSARRSGEGRQPMGLADSGLTGSR
jgi:endoglycosylceramidase